jgi:hypothetical protein
VKPTVSGTILTILLSSLANQARAGELNPPAGPVAPTHKTLTEVEPRMAVNTTNTPGDSDSLFKITLPGSYYLTGNISGVESKHGIEIGIGGVTLDLNGFDVLGVPGSLDGIRSAALNLTNISVVNGSIRAWGDQGVDLTTFNTSNCRVADLRTSLNAGTGIGTGPNSTLSNCLAYANGGHGLSAGNGGIVSNSSASFNTGNGIVVAFGCRVWQSSSYDNDGAGISAGNGSTVVECSARANTLDGILCTAACVIRGNTCSTNGNLAGNGAGIHATGGDNRIDGNNCTVADRGIDVDSAGNIIINNSCSGNATNWDIAADNVCAPILDLTAPASNAILGNSSPGSIGSSEPNANFSY